MNRGLIGTLVAVGIFVVIVGAIGIGWYNDAVSLEASVKAQWQQNQNNYDSFWKTVKETAQVTDRYAGDFKEVFLGAIEDRYSNGMGQVMAWVQEQNPQLSPELYTKLQTIIESGRKDFMRSQQDLLDKQRRYEVHLGGFAGGAYGSFCSFPREIGGDLRPPRDKDGDGRYTALDYPVVTSGKTQEVFSIGRDDKSVDVFGK